MNHSDLTFFPIWTTKRSTSLPLVAFVATQLDSDTESFDDSVETIESETNMAADDVVFDVELEAASKSEQEIGEVLKKDSRSAPGVSRPGAG